MAECYCQVGSGGPVGTEARPQQMIPYFAFNVLFLLLVPLTEAVSLCSTALKRGSFEKRQWETAFYGATELRSQP